MTTPYSSLALTLLVASMSFSLAAVAGPYDYDSSAGLTSDNQCGVGDNTRLISTSDVTSGGANASTCFGAYDGNLSGNVPLTWDGLTWDHIAKLDVSGSSLTQSGNLITLDFDSENQASGEWSFSGDTTDWSSFFVLTKAANSPGWAAYYFDDLAAAGNLSGTFSIPWGAGNSPNPADLSHLSLYAKTKAVVTVPEPGTLALLGLGLLGLVGSRRKQ